MNTSQDPKPLRWGILGASRIAAKVLPALQQAGATIVAVAASQKKKAESVAAEFGIARAYEGYARVLEDPDVEAVYNPLANSLHREWLLRTADAGKACLCEKPLALSAADAREVRDRFARAHCRLQEAFMWRHHPQVAWLAAQLVTGKLGAPQRLHAAFSFRLDRAGDYRWSAAMGGGVLWDIGCYGVNAARYFFRTEPVAASVRAWFRPGGDGVDETAVGWLDFGERRGATISCSFSSAFFQGIELVGSEGRAWVERPWISLGRPARVVIERDDKPTTQVFEPTNAYRSMIEHFTRAVRDPRLDLWPAEDGVAQAVAMEGVLASARNGGAPWRRES
ncbi:MAG: Gfo/Idh/MocA family oxidoreductase [Planctomycetota bacterium]